MHSLLGPFGRVAGARQVGAQRGELMEVGGEGVVGHGVLRQALPGHIHTPIALVTTP